MAHPQASSRSLEFFLDLGNLSGSVKGGTVVIPPATDEYWATLGPGTYQGWEFTVSNAGVTEVDELTAEAGSVYWDSVVLGLENGPEPLYGFKVSIRGYQDTVVQTTIPNTGGEPETVTAGTRTYVPQTAVDTKFTNPQKIVPPLWPRPEEDLTPEMQEWQGDTNTFFSMALRPRQFEGPALYG